MRPQPKQQNPTSFIRKWPRARRQTRGPQEYVKTQDYILDEADLGLSGLDQMSVLRGYIQKSTPVGWQFQILTVEMLSRFPEISVRAVVRYYLYRRFQSIPLTPRP